MGMDKLSLPWGKETIFEHCFRVLLKSNVQELVVVLSPQNIGFKNRFRFEKVKIVVNPFPEKGMSTSIQMGIKVIDPESQGILIALGDQPLLKTRTVNALVHAFSPRRGEIILPSYCGRRGNPVLFDRCYRKELLSLKGDVGGRSILKRFPEKVRLFRTESKGVLLDVDTWKDYKKIGRK